MSFSIASLFNCCTNKFKKVPIGFRSRFHGEILNTILPIRETGRIAVYEICLGGPSIKRLLSTGFIAVSNGE